MVICNRSSCRFCCLLLEGAGSAVSAFRQGISAIIAFVVPLYAHPDQLVRVCPPVMGAFAVSLVGG